MYALYIQLCSTRTEEQAKDLFQKILEVSKENVFFIFTFLLLDYSNGEQFERAWKEKNWFDCNYRSILILFCFLNKTKKTADWI